MYAALTLTLFRLALAPAVLLLLHLGASAAVFALLLVAGFASDVLDGVVARRAGAATPLLRRLDSAVDIVFYLSIAWAAWRLHPSSLRALKLPILLVVAGEIVNQGAALLKYGREPSYHAWSARVWGLLLFLSFFALLGFGSPMLLTVALAAGLLSQLESLGMTLVLPTWHHDVPTIRHAWRLRSS
jgi:phosphatidylglycerophosphate synthase